MLLADRQEFGIYKTQLVQLPNNHIKLAHDENWLRREYRMEMMLQMRVILTRFLIIVMICIYTYTYVPFVKSSL